ncbi:PREDICTED: protein RRP6-like 2 [Ipomoea nil]|uniref:protein RRP6-like 2 n=1 Tax=Ipomoea nil TaxID=35883 RepID=UPI000900DA43|nr:PREDICTED: protein RRP6-like 2 [Ipomoea nil]XP_019158079.1 PREDICTED: protein RRP6-like 2 [Ipomoea nil]
MIHTCSSSEHFQKAYIPKEKQVKKISDSDSSVEGREGVVKMGGPPVPFHISYIPKPQDEYRILVNNLSEEFEHVWLETSEDESRFIHPLEKFSSLDFVDTAAASDPVKPHSLDHTPFKLVEQLKDLKELVLKLQGVDEFAVDLEHNQYRSFLGITCLMQISTRTEDFVIDTLKLRIYVGPYLREIFKDRTKRKVMHGADKDILWLQRDFGIYICNLFDTRQASRVLKMEKNSLAYLLQHFCGIVAKKEYQSADWRLRPLPDEMLRYAREDTHFLLYIYDVMKVKLLSLSVNTESSSSPLAEVYKLSYEICMQLYTKDIWTDTSYLNIYGLPEAGFNAKQLAVVAGLSKWRDAVGRAADESTGYILPNRALLDIAKEMPLTSYRLLQLVKSKYPYIENNVDYLVNLIRNSIQASSAYEAGVECLKQMLRGKNSDVNATSNINGGDAKTSHYIDKL